VLVGVHLLIGLHVAHWRLAGRTLAPLELNEVMHTLELGVVTAGFLLMATAVVSVLFFGRFFCSWGCHLLALQDGAAWLLGRIGIRPMPLRSRALGAVAAGAAFYMFVWPQVARFLVRRVPAAEAVVGARPEFRLRVLADGEGWASFLTDDFARNLPGPGMAIVTFVVCGFAAVWLLGTRAFCRDVCPYGAVFSLADRFARRRIVLTGDCTACGRCTAACTSGISVFEEVTRHGAVTSGECLKDLDCVAVCPTRGLEVAVRRPPLFGRRGVARGWHLSWPEEIAALVLFLAALAAWRGLYRLVPFLLASTLAACLAFTTVLAARLLRRREVRLQRWRLRGAARVTARGWLFAGAAATALAATAHAGVVRWHEWRGDRAWDEWRAAAGSSTGAELARRALAHLDARERRGWLRPDDLEVRRAALADALGRSEVLERSLRTLAPVSVAARLDLAERLASRGRLAEAERELRAALAAEPELAPAHYGLGVVLAAGGRTYEAVVALRRARELAPADAEVLNNLGYLVGELGDVAEAEALLGEARRLAPEWALPCFNLAALFERSGRPAEAERLATSCPTGREPGGRIAARR
jgi:Flp pilus assembly protein TadD/ferredoxin